MAQRMKTGGRQKGTPNKPNPLKEHLRAQSTAYFQPGIKLEDSDVAAMLHKPLGSLVSQFEIDMSMMDAKDRAAIHEKLLRYHTPQMQSVSADVSLTADIEATISTRLARLAASNDK